ncbi:hypothetical protein HPB47_019087 [Ixodes persulcatus]|uniref:Uncharacterized protein n=1 Tax=Ixodes persulcatus TaxID=34615 RepID=A0AC60R2S7_IXOPE|nr:hypothetical protein HPB47_019087 [Ixodes persulcatus]
MLGDVASLRTPSHVGSPTHVWLCVGKGERGTLVVQLSPAGHGTRVLKILRAEWQRQARIYRSLLWTVLQDPSKPRSDNRRLREFLIIVDWTTEFLWQLSLQRLRSSVPKKRPAATGDVKTVSDVDLPVDARRVLSLGPKFAVEPRMSAPELLGLVRAVSRCAPVDEVERCISEVS